ncbi:uncharacterized protein ASPGLDRAFT_69144 [Aspergillus glaucus CBS 516.65]|uniref:Transferase family protein n=1 Tax=Aspergillus glaucus CBS 516.65 TaxID=1160497 RepID=A0A1L9V9U6_ASPGL|nr:hypothetical protein ASPGLDRAFT_69144 [Aspergillus glaucus CBS 516.65]OJJ80663.1 hypothetical protein ASPGLDRAFT_69144 [Aspergillus glaucus CBS 516.65]
MVVCTNVKVFIFYELQPSIHLDNLISSMVEGVRNATHQLPFMAGNFQVDDSSKLCIITPPGSHIEVNIRRTESMEHKSFPASAKNSFSPNDLDLTQLLPEEQTAENPVCALQLSLVEHGMILGFRINHAAGDWSSIDTFLSLICQSSKAHHEGLKMPTYTPDLNRAPYNAPATDPAISRQDLLERLPTFYIMEKSQFKPKPSPPSQSNIYKISEPSVQQLKAHCAPYLSEIDYVTSYDCIFVLIWTSITRVRLHLHPEKATSLSRFVHPIDVRTRDPENKTSERYFGNAVIGSQADPLTAQALVSDGDRDFTDMDMFMNTWYSGSAEKYDIGAASLPVAFRTHSSMAGACMVILPNFSRGATRFFEVLVHLAVEEHRQVVKCREFSHSVQQAKDFAICWCDWTWLWADWFLQSPRIYDQILNPSCISTTNPKMRESYDA